MAEKKEKITASNNANFTKNFERQELCLLSRISRFLAFYSRTAVDRTIITFCVVNKMHSGKDTQCD